MFSSYPMLYKQGERECQHIPAFPVLLILGSLNHCFLEEPGTATLKSLAASDSKYSKITEKSTTASINCWQWSSTRILPSYPPHPTTELWNSEGLTITMYHRLFGKELQIVLNDGWSSPMAYTPWKLVVENFISWTENKIFLSLFQPLHYSV